MFELWDMWFAAIATPDYRLRTGANWGWVSMRFSKAGLSSSARSAGSFE
jgi:hypothetical protein